MSLIKEMDQKQNGTAELQNATNSNGAQKFWCARIDVLVMHVRGVCTRVVQRAR